MKVVAVVTLAVCTVVATAGATVQENAKCGNKLDRIEYKGFDIKVVDFSDVTTAPDQCCDLCATTAGCKLYTLMSHWANDGNHRYECMVKSQAGEKVDYGEHPVAGLYPVSAFLNAELATVNNTTLVL